MGLLDDAIREHLDLKRRRGGDPAEIERLERDALGPGEVDRWAETGEEPDEPSPPPPHAAESPQTGEASGARSSGAPEPIVFDHLSQPTAEYDVVAEESAAEAHGAKAKGLDGED